MEDARRRIKVEDLNAFFKNFEDLVEKDSIDPRLIANFDETMIKVDKKFKRVLIPRSAKYGIKGAKDKKDKHVTLGVTIFSRSDFCCRCPPLIIVPQSEWPVSFGSFIAESLHVSGSANGWVTMDIYESWVETTFIPAVRGRRILFGLEGRWALLLVDGHSSRLSEKAILALRREKIHCLVIVAHSSHVAQPLDLRIFQVFHSYMKSGSYVYRLFDRDTGLAMVTKDAIRHCSRHFQTKISKNPSDWLALFRSLRARCSTAPTSPGVPFYKLAKILRGNNARIIPHACDVPMTRTDINLSECTKSNQKKKEQQH